jgi:hypothetical protein
MLRPNERGIPPHMLHLYETKSASSKKSTEFHDDSVRLPAILSRLSSHVLGRLKSLRSNAPSEDFIPDSAKNSPNSLHETQYLGEFTLRDTRWNAS